MRNPVSYPPFPGEGFTLENCLSLILSQQLPPLAGEGQHEEKVTCSEVIFLVFLVIFMTN